MNKLLSFHGKQEIKDFYLARVKAHRAADEIVKGRYWEGGKGCAVGCTVHSSSHSDYEDLIGIPRIIARLQDRIFEGMSNNKAKEFPVRFLEDMPVGVDLDNVWRKFLSWLLIDEKEGVIKHAKTEAVRVSILNVGNLLEKSTVSEVSKEDFIEVKNAAAAYADAAAYAADAYAAYAAAYAADAYADAAADADAAAYAADAYAAYAAAYAADADAAAYAADAYAAYAAAYAADAYAAYAADAYAADAAARTRKYDLMADKLLELIKEAK